MSASQPDNIVLISGANQGIGFAIAKKLAMLPSYHILLGSRNVEKGEAAARSLSSPNVEFIQLDITDNESISRAVQGARSKYGRLDVLLNNAGVMPKPASQSDGRTMRTAMSESLETNVVSTAQVTESFLPLLLKSSDPRIFFMSSALGSVQETLNPSFSFYGYENPGYKVAKAGINMLTVHYAVKLRGQNVKVNACCPVAVSTHMNNYRKGLGSVDEGTINAVRLVTEGVETGTFTNKEGNIPW